MHGDDVRALQAQLAELGFTDARGRSLRPDGDFGPTTHAAIQAFQRDHELTADGIVGPATLAAVEEAVRIELRSIGQQDVAYLRGQEQTEALSAYQPLAPRQTPTLTAPYASAEEPAMQRATKAPVDEPVSRSLPATAPAPRLDERAHPDHGLYQDARALVRDLDRQHAREPDQYSDNLSAALVVAARTDGLSRIDRIELNQDASKLTAIETSFGRPDKRTELPVMASLETSLERSSEQWRAAMDTFELREEVSRGLTQERNLGPQRTWSSPTHATALESAHGRDDPRHPGNPNHDLYNELQKQVPQASEDRLLQFTAACHMNRITADNLTSVKLDEDRMTLEFQGAGLLTTPARIDLSIPPTHPQEAVAQIQQFDRHETQIMENFQMQQQAQMSMGHSR